MRKILQMQLSRLYQDETVLAQTVKDYQKLVKQNFSLEAVWNIVKEDFE